MILGLCQRGGGGGGGGVTPTNSIHSFRPGQSEVKRSRRYFRRGNYGSGKVGKKHDRMTIVHLLACIVGQGVYWGKVKRSTLKFASQNS